jgi:hypothetical protein
MTEKNSAHNLQLRQSSTTSIPYPYHQALGFILQRAGVPEEELAPLKQRAIRLKFYLDYGMNQPAYDPAWKLYYPRDLP